MLEIVTSTGAGGCDALRRRDFLRVGALGCGAMTLADRLRLTAEASPAGGYVRDKAIVLLFLSGGPSQYETFDPKPEGPGTSTSLAGHFGTRSPASVSRRTCPSWRSGPTGSRCSARFKCNAANTMARPSNCSRPT